MSKHTPGPWYVQETPQGFIITKGSDPFDEQITDHVYTKGNAYLIAAAPLLLEQLEDMLSSLKVLGINGLDTEIKNSTAVVARARGEA